MVGGGWGGLITNISMQNTQCSRSFAQGLLLISFPGRVMFHYSSTVLGPFDGLCALARREAETDGRKLVRHVLKEIRGVEADCAREEQCKRKLGGATLCQSSFLGRSYNINYYTIGVCRGHILLAFVSQKLPHI